VLAAVIEVARLFLMFGGTTALAWIIVGLVYGELNPMLWPDIVFMPTLALTLTAWLGVVLFVEILRSDGHD
jgi:hypothetical protein